MIPEWLPDWKDESQYPIPDETSREQWAWEFLRRNPEYQEDYAAIKKAEPLSMDQLEWYDRLRDKYEAKLIDPASPHPEEPYFFRASVPPQRVTKRGMPDTQERHCPVQHYAFDLREPIKPQVEAAREAMEWRHKEYRRIDAIPPIHRAQPKKYQTYLRLLDADLSSATINAIARYIYGKGSRPLNKIDTQNVNDDLKAAKLLCGFDYRFIPIP